MTTCGEALVELLEAYGIDTVFGIPGVHTVELYRALPRTRLRHVTPRHEQGAGFMADGYARASGRPAACFIITGPGMTNIATAMGQAYADSVPMLVVSSVNRTTELGLGEGRLHELPSQHDLSSGLTVFSHSLLGANELPDVLARAFTVFNTHRPGPVHLELPLDVITASAADMSRRTVDRWPRPGPDPDAIGRAAALLRRARHPMVILGGGACAATGEARRLVDRLGALTASTINGKGILPPDHPLALGATLPQRPVMSMLRTADVVLAVGTELAETDTLLFDGRLELAGKLIRIDIDADQLTRNVLPEVAIVSDAGLALAALESALQGFQPDPATAGIARRVHTELEQLLTPAQRVHRRLLCTLEDALPGLIVVGDSTQPVYSANVCYEPKSPRSFFNSSTGYGTLGYALPAALGAKLAMPGRPVVALIGDGGLQFTIGELATAVELALPVPIVVWNNRGYGEIKRYMSERGIPQIGVDLYTPDFQAIARGFGCAAHGAESFEHLRELLAGAGAAGGPTLIEVDEAAAARW